MANLIDQSIANNLEQSSTTSSSSSSPASFHSTTIISTSIDLNPSIFEHQNGSTKNLLQTNNDNELTMPMMMMMVTEFSSIISSADESYSTSATTTSVTQSSFIERMHYIKIALLALMFILILCGNTFVLIALNVSIVIHFYSLDIIEFFQPVLFHSETNSSSPFVIIIDIIDIDIYLR